MQYQFPRVRVTFDKESLDLSKECKNDLDKISDLNSIDSYVKKYGISCKFPCMLNWTEDWIINRHLLCKTRPIGWTVILFNF
jgi:hypothetical protein